VPPRRRSGATAAPARRERSVALPRHDFVSILDRLLRGPAYIATVGILLVGIVFFNVDVLELNHGIARTDARASELKRENATLTLQLAKLGSSERIQQVALQRGLVLPQPGDVRYLRAHRDDAARAVRVMTAPASTSATTAASTAVSQQSAAALGGTTTPTATTTPTPTATTTPTPAATTTPTPTATPAPATAPVTTTGAGAVTAPATTP
jgi:cell division protein FtsL